MHLDYNKNTWSNHNDWFTGIHWKFDCPLFYPDWYNRGQAGIKGRQPGRTNPLPRCLDPSCVLHHCYKKVNFTGVSLEKENQSNTKSTRILLFDSCIIITLCEH